MVPGWRCGSWATRIRARRLSAINAWAVVRLQFQPKGPSTANPAKAAIGESNRLMATSGPGMSALRKWALLRFEQKGFRLM